MTGEFRRRSLTDSLEERRPGNRRGKHALMQKLGTGGGGRRGRKNEAGTILPQRILIKKRRDEGFTPSDGERHNEEKEKRMYQKQSRRNVGMTPAQRLLLRDAAFPGALGCVVFASREEAGGAASAGADVLTVCFVCVLGLRQKKEKKRICKRYLYMCFLYVSKGVFPCACMRNSVYPLV